MSSLQREQLQDRGLARGRQVGPQVQRDFRGGFSFLLQKIYFFPGPVQAVLPGGVLVRLLPPGRLRGRWNAVRGRHFQQMHCRSFEL